jgi:hypothetical protein
MEVDSALLGSDSLDLSNGGDINFRIVTTPPNYPLNSGSGKGGPASVEKGGLSDDDYVHYFKQLSLTTRLKTTSMISPTLARQPSQRKLNFQLTPQTFTPGKR